MHLVAALVAIGLYARAGYCNAAATTTVVDADSSAGSPTVEERQVQSFGPLPDGEGWAFYLYENGNCDTGNYVTGYVGNETSGGCVNISPYYDFDWDTIQVFKGSLYNINLFSEADCPYGFLNNPVQYDCETDACIKLDVHEIKSYLVQDRLAETCSCCEQPDA